MPRDSGDEMIIAMNRRAILARMPRAAWIDLCTMALGRRDGQTQTQTPEQLAALATTLQAGNALRWPEHAAAMATIQRP